MQRSILDIKLPSAKVFVMQDRRFRFSANVLEACAQVREYSCYFDDVKHQQLIRDQYGLSASRPRLFIVIGRLGKVEPHELRRAELDLSQVHVRTYDDLLLKMRTRVAALEHRAGIELWISVSLGSELVNAARRGMLGCGERVAVNGYAGPDDQQCNSHPNPSQWRFTRVAKDIQAITAKTRAPRGPRPRPSA